MGIIDLLFLAILVLGFISGLQKGLITSFLACIAMAAASLIAGTAKVSLAQKFMLSDFRVWLENNIDTGISVNMQQLFTVISYVLMFAFIYIAIMLVVNFINNVFRVPKLRVLDGFLGGVLGIVRAYGIICLIIAVAPIVARPINTEIVPQMLSESMLGRFFTSESPLSDLFGIAVKIARMG